ncbi:MAG TPA: class I SAM-dependent methyltransferase [Streptosporangiaceae bacterium]
MRVIDLGELTALEDRHWWHRQRRAIVERELRRFPATGRVLDIGAGYGGHTIAMRAMGWIATAVDSSAAAAEVARDRGVSVVRADARDLPVEPGFIDVVVAFDVLEHIDEDHLVMQEIARVLRPGGGTALVAVPYDSYSRESLTGIAEKAALAVDWVRSWNVLLRGFAVRRRAVPGSACRHLPWPVNTALSAAVAAERVLPVRSLRGTSLIMRAHRE